MTDSSARSSAHLKSKSLPATTGSACQAKCNKAIRHQSCVGGCTQMSGSTQAIMEMSKANTPSLALVCASVRYPIYSGRYLLVVVECSDRLLLLRLQAHTTEHHPDCIPCHGFFLSGVTGRARTALYIALRRPSTNIRSNNWYSYMHISTVVLGAVPHTSGCHDATPHKCVTHSRSVSIQRPWLRGISPFISDKNSAY